MEILLKQELDDALEEFKEEDPALVHKALEACIGYYGRSEWNCMYSGNQNDILMAWINGYKYRDKEKIVIKDIGFAQGGLIPKQNDKKMVVVKVGWWKCKKCGEVFESYSDPPLNHSCRDKK